MSYTLYHGCIKSAVEPIIHGEYGLEYGNNKIVHPWSCADGDTIFFHDATLVKESECIYDDDNETAIQYCIERCNELKACEMISQEGYYFEDLFTPNSVDSYKIESINLKNF